MSAIGDDDVRHVAMLARLGLSDAQVRELSSDLRIILEHMEVLRHVPTAGVPEFGRDAAAGMPLRQDTVDPAPLTLAPADMAPDARDGFLLVPRLSTHDDAAANKAP